jgi:hypothetical protein
MRAAAHDDEAAEYAECGDKQRRVWRLKQRQRVGIGLGVKLGRLVV